HPAHLGVRDLAAQRIQSLTQAGVPIKALEAHERDRLVGWKVAFVILQDREVQGINQASRRISSYQVNLAFSHGSVAQAEIHDSGRFGERQTIGRRQSTKPVFPFHEFVSESSLPLGRKGRRLTERAQFQSARGFASNEDDELVVEAERLGQFNVEL